MGQMHGVERTASELARIAKLDYEAAARFVGVSVRTLRRARAAGAIGYIRSGRRVFFARKDLIAYRDTLTYVQPALPGMEGLSSDPADAVFTDEQASGAARALDRIRVGKARRSLEGEAVA